MRARRHGFVAAAVTLTIVFAAGATPIPVFGHYRRVDGFSDADLSLVAVAYFVSAVTALLLLGRLSTHLGRKPVSLAAIGLALIGCLVLTQVDAVPVLVFGRVLQGIAAGLASSAVTAYAVDTAPARPRWLVSTVAASATNLGLTVGAFVSGTLVDRSSRPDVLPYLVVAGLLAACAVLLATGPETLPRSRGAWVSLRPRLTVPAGARPFLLPSAAVFVGTWSIGGYYQAFGSSVAADALGRNDAVVAAAVFASYMAPSILGGPLFAQLGPARAQRVGMVVVGMAALGLAAAVLAGSAGWFLLAGLVGGLGMGGAITGSMALLLAPTRQVDRAGLLALVYAISYTGAALPSLVAGQVTRVASLETVTTGYAVLVVLLTGVVLATGRAGLGERPSPEPVTPG